MTLTREQVLEMGAGEKMDKLVSILVMGYTTFDDFPVHAVHTWHTPTSFKPFEPSSGISAAWEVVEKMKNEGYRVIVNVSDEKSGEVIRGMAKAGDWHSNMLQGEERHNHAYAETAPLAICRAALLTTIGEGV